MQKNPVVFWELATHDMEKTIEFFKEVFEWKIEFSDRLGFYIIPEISSLDEPSGVTFAMLEPKPTQPLI